MSRVRQAALVVAVNLAVLAALLLLIEGAASAVLALRDDTERADLAERLHTAHDPELGWVNIPERSHPDMYGPGIGLTINPQGFRGTRPTTGDVPPGMVRVVCSGDSFTLGFGVADSATWCHQLGVIDARLEPVNMGQGGYGFDQAFLWYRRDGMPLDHQVQVMAFISDDFRRMEDDHFLGFPKPLLTLVGDSLHVSRVPRPPRTGVLGFFARFADPVHSLRSVELLRRLRVRATGGADAPTPSDSARASAARARVRPVVARVIATLAERHHASGSRLLLVHLPTAYELDGFVADVAREWGAFVSQEAEAQGVGYLDLFPAFEALDPASREAMFIAPEAVDFPAAAGHYTAAGNRLVARAVHAELERAGWLPASRPE